MGISRKREREREEKIKSRDLSNRSLKTDGVQRAENLRKDRYQKDISEDRQRRYYIIGMSQKREGRREKEEGQRSE